MATLTFEPHYKYILELSCSQCNDSNMSKISPAQIFDSALMRIPKYSMPQKYGTPIHFLAPNVPSGMIGQYYNVAQKYIIDTHLTEPQLQASCKNISSTHQNCSVKIIQRLIQD